MKKDLFNKKRERDDFNSIRQIEKDHKKMYIIADDDHHMSDKIYLTKEMAMKALKDLNDDPDETLLAIKEMRRKTKKVMNLLNNRSFDHLDNELFNNNTGTLPSEIEFIWNTDLLLVFKQKLEWLSKSVDCNPIGSRTCSKEQFEAYLEGEKNNYQKQGLYELTDTLYQYLWSNQDRWTDFSMGSALMMFSIIENTFKKREAIIKYL